jgi:hypothetical protein
MPTAPSVALALFLALALVLALGPQPSASAPCGRPALARTQQPFVLFGAMPLVGHLTPLVMQALELKGRGTARRVVATTLAFVGSPHGEILEVLAAAAPSTVEFIEAGYVNLTSGGIVRADILDDPSLSVSGDPACPMSAPIDAMGGGVMEERGGLGWGGVG